MHKQPFAKLVLASSIALALAACGSSSGHVDAPPSTTPPPVTLGDTFALTVSNKLLSFDRENPAKVMSTVAIGGLQAGETLVGIDVRPADGMLYGVGSSGRLYTIDAATGAATLKSTLVADPADTTAPYAGLAGTDFGVDFNPVADRLRVVGNGGQNLRINVDTGATTTDGNINGAAGAAITASAYTNSFAGTASTTLYAIDGAKGTLYVQNPPNDGTLAAPVTLGTGAFTGSVNGFDIDARTNTGYMVATVGQARNLYTVNLGAAADAARLVMPLAVTEDIRGIALRARSATVLALGDDNRLLGFKPSTPNTLDSNVPITGLAGGETLVGIDVRPKDGVLWGLTTAARLVTIDPVTGVASVKATLAADTLDATAPYTGMQGTAFAVDFNPVADRLRVIGNTGQSLRINVDTGATTTDGNLNRAGVAPSVAAAAYTNSVPGATSTQLFDLDSASAVLALQNPPNDGVLADVGPLGVAIAGDGGMDIGGGANGLVLAALRTSAAGASSLYRVNLATGAATPVNGAATPATSVIGGGSPGVKDIAIWMR